MYIHIRNQEKKCVCVWGGGGVGGGGGKERLNSETQFSLQRLWFRFILNLCNN